jgi:hypothetical protein
MRVIKQDTLLSQLLGVLLIMLCAAIVVLPLVLQSLLLQDTRPRDSIVAMMEGGAEKPFVYRALVPAMASAITAVTPDVVKTVVTKRVLQWDIWQQMAQHVIVNAGETPKMLSPHYVYPIVVVILLMYMSVVMYGAVLGQLSAALFPHYRRTTLPSDTALAGILMLLMFLNEPIKVYDFPVLAFFSLGLLFLLSQRWAYYLAVFFIATFNKETTILLAGVFAVYYWKRMERKKFLSLLAAQCGLYALAIAILHAVFAASPGEYFHTYGEVIANEFARFSVVRGGMVLAVIGLVISRWKDFPPLLRCSLWLLAADAAIYVRLGQYHEYRVFFDALPVVTVMLAYSISRMRIRQTA